MQHRLQTWVTPKAVKGRPSNIAGKGVFAVERVLAGEVVEIKAGHIVDRQTLRTLPEHLQNSEIGIAEGLHLVALGEDELEDIMLYLNHSCEPNCGLEGNIVFVAMRDIAPGEELTIDYAMIDDHDDETMTCTCRTPSCRGRITGKDWQRPELQARYGNYFSSYLLRQMDPPATRGA